VDLIDSREEESPEDDDKALRNEILGNGQRARGCLHLGKGTGQTAGETSRGQADGDESSGLHERM
jgi:hypothetical protein